jgi:hypothetical protein
MHAYYLKTDSSSLTEFTQDDSVIYKIMRSLTAPWAYFSRTAYYLLPDNPTVAQLMAIRYRNATRLYFTSAVAIPAAMILVLAAAILWLLSGARRRQRS